MALLFPDVPKCCAFLAWLLYKLFQERWAARCLAAQYLRTYGSFPYAPSLRGSLYGSGFAPQLAARARPVTDIGVHVVGSDGVPRSQGYGDVRTVVIPVGLSEADDARVGGKPAVPCVGIVRGARVKLCGGQRGGNGGAGRNCDVMMNSRRS